MTDSGSLQGAVVRMARRAGGMDLRISRIHRVASGSMTPGTLGGHRHPTGVNDVFVVIGKAAMTGGTIAAAVTAANGRTILAGSRAKQAAIGAMTRSAGVMYLRIIGINGVSGSVMAPRTVAVHADHGVVIDSAAAMITGKATMTG